MKYVEKESNPELCPFCEAFSGNNDPENLVIFRGKNAFVMVNRYPYTTGHVMILPIIHQEKLSELDKKTRTEMMELINKAINTVQNVYQPQGFNVGLNVGAAAGAGIPRHLHWHVVPRWQGDTNFMTTVGGVRVLPESLEDSYKRISSAWQGK
jgi:ATP adenylyltransferase